MKMVRIGYREKSPTYWQVYTYKRIGQGETSILKYTEYQIAEQKMNWFLNIDT